MTATVTRPSDTRATFVSPPVRARHVAASRMPAALMRTTVDVEVVIPSYNEEGRLPATLAAITAELAALDLTTRVVVVDNASSDRTAEIVDRYSDTTADGPEVVVIGCATRGKGAAVRRGMLTSTARVVGFVDADLSVPATALPMAIASVLSGDDVVIASRRAPGASYAVKQPRFRRIGSWGFRSAIASLVPGVTDSQCGFKFFSLAAARDVFNDMDVVGFAFDVEMLMRARRSDYTTVELPVSWTDDTASTLGLASHAPEIARDILRLHRIDSALERRSRFAPRRGEPAGVEDTFAAMRAERANRATAERLLGVA
ncbi:glycosyltransferase [Jatrophihabitans endophyticus]|uniref:glycosyltransferase n=1 Tax=Jatrophihabitans endophyticus TaxID=1206085 RepID=UPI0019DE9275|nr:glycosyltransferase [Jatrophihabitans endophyticus]MBE7187644.1 glycosyltransferase [Jatrophihabitans endophyticus]